MDKDRIEKKYYVALWFIFIVYILVLLKLVLFKDGIKNVGVSPMEDRVSLVPFKATLGILRYMAPIRAIENILGNVVIFIPFGFILPLITAFRKRIILLGCLFSCAIEIVQYCFVLGFTDIDDVIYNTLGAIIGYMIFLLFSQKIKPKIKLLKTSTVFISILGIMGMAILAYNGLLL